jgi:hypothetical protein
MRRKKRGLLYLKGSHKGAQDNLTHEMACELTYAVFVVVSRGLMV